MIITKYTIKQKELKELRGEWLKTGLITIIVLTGIIISYL
jgi:hypothetical protein